MIANAHEALKLLRHKRTGEPMESRVIARNTRLVYLHDELVGLKFHRTVVARYVPDGVVIDTRDRFRPDGWHTVTTWRRIDEFTPARTYTERGVRYVNDRLYTHGMFVSSDGSWVNASVEPVVEAEVARTLRNFPRRLRRHADRVIAAWVDWQQPPECCHAHMWYPDREDPDRTHYLTHVLAGEPVVPGMLTARANELREENFYGKRLVERLRGFFRTALQPLTGERLTQLCPELPYPQLEPRRT